MSRAAPIPAGGRVGLGVAIPRGMSRRPLIPQILFAAALGGCSTSAPPKQGSPLSAPQSFVVHGQLTLTSLPGLTLPQSIGTLPTAQDFVLRVDPAGGTSLIGAPGEAVPALFASDDGVAFKSTDSLNLQLLDQLCAGSAARYSDFHFSATSDGVTGMATGTAEIIHGDVGFGYMARLDFTGIPDTAGPSLANSATNPDPDPLRPLSLLASEPLPAQVTAQAVGGGDTIPLIPFLPAGAGAGIGFFSKPNIALRYGTTYTIAVDPWTDLAGNAGTPIAALTTIEAPPLVAEDGFEGADATVGGAAVVAATILAPISGQKSALLSSDYGLLTLAGGVSGRLTVRLAVSPGDRFVRFSLRPLAQYSQVVGTYGTSIRMAVPGGEIANIALPTTETLSVQQTLPNGASVWLGDVRTVEAPLPATVGSEVVFDVDMYQSFQCGLPVQGVSYLLDDLRVE